MKPSITAMLEELQEAIGDVQQHVNNYRDPNQKSDVLTSINRAWDLVVEIRARRRQR